MKKAKLGASAVILSGGENSRMGLNKAFMEINGEVIIEGLVTRLASVFDEIIIVANKIDEYAYLDCDVVRDIFPGNGPLSGIHAGLCHSKHPYSLILACDMPFVDPELGSFLLAKAANFDVVVPQIGEYIQPLFAIYSKTCIQPLEQCFANSQRKITSLYKLVEVNHVPKEAMEGVADLDRVFININSPDDLRKLPRLP